MFSDLRRESFTGKHMSIGRAVDKWRSERSNRDAWQPEERTPGVSYWYLDDALILIGHTDRRAGERHPVGITDRRAEIFKGDRYSGEQRWIETLNGNSCGVVGVVPRVDSALLVHSEQKKLRPSLAGDKLERVAANRRRLCIGGRGERHHESRH